MSSLIAETPANRNDTTVVASCGSICRATYTNEFFFAVNASVSDCCFESESFSSAVSVRRILPYDVW